MALASFSTLVAAGLGKLGERSLAQPSRVASPASLRVVPQQKVGDAVGRKPCSPRHMAVRHHALRHSVQFQPLCDEHLFDDCGRAALHGLFQLLLCMHYIYSTSAGIGALSSWLLHWCTLSTCKPSTTAGASLGGFVRPVGPSRTLRRSCHCRLRRHDARRQCVCFDSYIYIYIYIYI